MWDRGSIFQFDITINEIFAMQKITIGYSAYEYDQVA